MEKQGVAGILRVLSRGKSPTLISFGNGSIQAFWDII
jgi:hypothetical protein